MPVTPFRGFVSIDSAMDTERYRRDRCSHACRIRSIVNRVCVEHDQCTDRTGIKIPDESSETRSMIFIDRIGGRYEIHWRLGSCIQDMSKRMNPAWLAFAHEHRCPALRLPDIRQGGLHETAFGFG